MNNYSDFPPFDFFKRVLLSIPNAALIYASIWKLKSKSNHISIKRTYTKRQFLISPTVFRNHLLSLARLQLITFEETPDFFLINFYEN